ncbi:MAG: hypothetical protein INQ03_12375 [Candidatus Heimdallarchaeota archaeon]|nr:hypothetical protein [Candidatus Heimdallarchaeota archaeon]
MYKIDEPRDNLYDEVYAIYKPIASSSEAYKFDLKLDSLFSFYLRGKILTRVRAVEAILDIFGSLTRYLTTLHCILQQWEKAIQNNETYSTPGFSTLDEVALEIRRVNYRIEVFILTLQFIIDEEESEKVINGIVIYFDSRKPNFSKMNKASMNQLLENIELHPLNSVDSLYNPD